MFLCNKLLWFLFILGSLRADVLRISLPTAMQSIDPAMSRRSYNRVISRQCFEGLMGYDKNGHLECKVAAFFQRKDLHTWFFRLKKGIRWSDGHPVTAEDFVYAIRRQLLDSRFYYSGEIAYLKNVRKARSKELSMDDIGIRAVDAHTLMIETEEPFDDLPYLLAHVPMFPVPKHVIEKFSDQWTRPEHIVSNGAYVLKEYHRNVKVVLKKNQYYRLKEDVHFPIVVIQYLPTNVSLRLYKKGYMDACYIDHYMPSLLHKYPNQLHAFPLLSTVWVSFNTKSPVMENVHLRRAISMGMDRSYFQEPLYNITPRGIHGIEEKQRYHYGWQRLSLRQEMAKHLIQGIALQKPIRFAYSLDNQEDAKLVLMMLYKLGLPVQNIPMERKEYINKVMNIYSSNALGRFPKDVDLMLFQYSTFEHDREFINVWHSSIAIGYYNALVDRMLLQHAPVQAIESVEDYAMVNLYQRSLYLLVRPKLSMYCDKLGNLMLEYTSK